MKRFLILILFFTSCTFSFGQNLIPNPSAEDYVECPSSLNGIEIYLNNWQKIRGSPDYFNNCSNGLGSNNPLGYQEPRTGEGYLGAIPFHQNLENYREYFGTELLEPLVTGETYTVCFYVSLAYRINVADRAVDNLGFLLMTTNYLEYSDGQGEILNYSTFAENTVITDTTNWVQITSTFVADSAYQVIAFGNFYDDDNTTVELQIPDGIAWVSYYYFDDFSLNAGDDCGMVNSLQENENVKINLFPNPASDILNIQSSSGIQLIRIYDSKGQLLKHEEINNQLELKIDLDFESGIYIAKIKTEKGYTTKRFMVQ